MNTAGETWRWAAFEDLSGREVHDLLKLRGDVFVVEQCCAFPEIDGRDVEAFHLLWRVEGSLAACLRVFAPDTQARARIGRLATASRFRGQGLGHRLMAEALRFCAERFPGCAIDLSAQAHLVSFYESHGFASVSEPYSEDDILHVDMRRHGGDAS